MRTEVACGRVGRSSVRMSCAAWVQDIQVARASSRYVCVNRGAGRRAEGTPSDRSSDPTGGAALAEREFAGAESAVDRSPSPMVGTSVTAVAMQLDRLAPCRSSSEL